MGSGLRELDISKNKLTGEDVSGVIELIRENVPNLRVINLKDNFLRDQTGEEIVNALKGNVHLTRVLLELNPLKHYLLKEVESFGKRNLENKKEE